MVTMKYAPPTEQECETAREARAKITAMLQSGAPATLQVNGATSSEAIVLPAGVLELLNEILDVMAAGHGVAVMPQYAELTTRQAAEILNVSRPHLVKLLDSGEIPFHMVGSHRRISREDVEQYSVELRRRREAILAKMVAESQALGLYD